MLTAWVRAPLHCPEQSCGNLLSDISWFPWGGVFSADVNSGPVYSLGNGVLWFCTPAGQVPAYTIFPHGGGNQGDPGHPDVDVFIEMTPYRRCPGCSTELLGVVTSVRADLIVGVRAVEPGNWDPFVLARSYGESEFADSGIKMEWTISQPFTVIDESDGRRPL